jgi:hypothetical protein
MRNHPGSNHQTLCSHSRRMTIVLVDANITCLFCNIQLCDRLWPRERNVPNLISIFQRPDPLFFFNHSEAMPSFSKISSTVASTERGCSVRRIKRFVPSSRHRPSSPTPGSSSSSSDHRPLSLSSPSCRALSPTGSSSPLPGTSSRNIPSLGHQTKKAPSQTLSGKSGSGSKRGRNEDTDEHEQYV